MTHAGPQAAADPRSTVSVVLPVHDEEHRLRPAVDAIVAHLVRRSAPWEILIVENGSRDRTADIAAELTARHASVRTLRLEEPGKGRAVREGMLAARGAYRFMCDVDLSMPIEQIDRFLPPTLNDFDVAIGSREHPASEVRDRFVRRACGRVFNLVVRMLVLPGIRDSQCGFKCFSASAAETVFPHVRLEGYAFDVEALCIARHAGLRIVELPITWRVDTDSRVRLFRDGLRMLRDLSAIRRWRRVGAYDAVTRPTARNENDRCRVD